MATQIPSIDEIVVKMKSEVIDDIMAGRVPYQVKSFGELHDYVDANCYGGFCDDDFSDRLIGYFGGRDQHEGMSDGMLDYINEAQTQIDTWLKYGGVEAHFEDLSWEDFTPMMYGELLIKHKKAMWALDIIRSNPEHWALEGAKDLADKTWKECQ